MKKKTFGSNCCRIAVTGTHDPGAMVTPGWQVHILVAPVGTAAFLIPTFSLIV
jgi:hypothetical protein